MAQTWVVEMAASRAALRADPWVAAMAVPWAFLMAVARAGQWAAYLAAPSAVALVVD